MTGPQSILKHEGAEYWIYAEEVIDIYGQRIEGVIACTAAKMSPPPHQSVITNSGSPHLHVSAKTPGEGAKAVEAGIKEGRFTTS